MSVVATVAIWRPQIGQDRSSKGQYMSASASPILDMCKAPQQQLKLRYRRIGKPISGKASHAQFES